MIKDSTPVNSGEQRTVAAEKVYILILFVGVVISKPRAQWRVIRVSKTLKTIQALDLSPQKGNKLERSHVLAMIS